MASIEWKGITRDVSRHGKVRWYFRAPGKPRIRLQGEPGSEEFALAYFAARNGEAIPAPRQTGPRRGTFGYIVRHYLTSRDFKALDRKLTQRPRERLLEALDEKIGHLPAMIDPMTIRLGVKTRTYAQGKDFLAALRAVYRLACDDGLVPSDPTAGIRRKPNVTEGHRTWTAEDCKAYEEKHPLGTQARTAYAIGLYTAQRISDAVKIGRPHEERRAPARRNRRSDSAASQGRAGRVAGQGPDLPRDGLRPALRHGEGATEQVSGMVPGGRGTP
jgi:hypothetical protein